MTSWGGDHDAEMKARLEAMVATGWAAWRPTQPEEHDRDVDARDAFRAGYVWGASHARRSWHESARDLILGLAVIAAFCYFLSLLA